MFSCLHVYYVHAVPKEVRSKCWVWNLVTGVCELPDVCEPSIIWYPNLCGCWYPNLDPLKEQ